MKRRRGCGRELLKRHKTDGVGEEDGVRTNQWGDAAGDYFEVVLKEDGSESEQLFKEPEIKQFSVSDDVYDEGRVNYERECLHGIVSNCSVTSGDYQHFLRHNVPVQCISVSFRWSTDKVLRQNLTFCRF